MKTINLRDQEIRDLQIILTNMWTIHKNKIAKQLFNKINKQIN